MDTNKLDASALSPATPSTDDGPHIGKPAMLAWSECNHYLDLPLSDYLRVFAGHERRRGVLVCCVRNFYGEADPVFDVAHVSVAHASELFDENWLDDDEIEAYDEAVRNNDPESDHLVFFVTDGYIALYRLPRNGDRWSRVEVPVKERA